jgi:exosortase
MPAEAAQTSSLLEPSGRPAGQPEAALNAPQSRTFQYLSFIWCAAWLAIAFGPVLAGLAKVWMQDGDMSHGALAPLIAGWVAWQERARLRSLESRPSRWGLVCIVGACLGTMVGLPAGWDSFTRFAFLISIIGAVLYFHGAPALRALAFPLLLLAFMIPPPAFLYEEITLPLQLVASRIAEYFLEFLGVSVLRYGNILELAGQKLSVAEACSGIRSLFSLCFFGLVYGYLFDGRRWVRWVLLTAAAPIAIVANSLRIVLTGVFGESNPSFVHGAMHGYSGWLVFLAAVVAMAGFHYVLRLAPRPLARYRRALAQSGMIPG